VPNENFTEGNEDNEGGPKRSALVLGRSRAKNGKWVVISTAVETVDLAAPEDERTPLLQPDLVVLTRCARSEGCPPVSFYCAFVIVLHY